ncbi:MAG: BatD protein, partial [Flavobacterium sp.]|nr:BatD protein [Flavobacterium sp.]
LILPLIVLFKKKKDAIDSDVFGNRIKMNNRLAKKYLSEAKKQINNKELFYVALEKAMHNFLKAKLHIETSDMSKRNIQQLLLSRNAGAQTVIDFLELTENCELARFAQSSSTAINQDFNKAVMIISDLEKQIK